MRTSTNAGAARRALLVAAVTTALLAAGCSSDDDAAPATTDPSGSTTAAGPVPPERFEGSVDDFYRVPDPLPAGEPGQLIRVQEVARDAEQVTLRVMYHSRDARRADRAVTGIVTYPTAAAPEDGWPVVALAHGTTGLAPKCAPSRGGEPAPAFGIEGVRVVTDYVGLGPLGERHPYLSGRSEANSVVDSVRAARNLADANAGTRWVAIGHSQGGHAALFTNELAAEIAPELELVGTVSSAPAAMLEHTYGPDDQVVPRMVGIMALYGLAADNPALDPDDYIGPDVAARADVIDTGCSMEVAASMVQVPAEDFYETDPLTTEPALSILRENDPGKVAADTPLLLLKGLDDTWVVPARVDALFDRLCDAGQVTELDEVPGGDHDNLLSVAADRIDGWLQARLDGDEPTDSCDQRAPEPPQ